MTRIALTLCLILLGSLARSEARAANALASNIAPLAFGMTQQQVTDALGAPLTYIAGRPGNEVYFSVRDTRVPGYPVGEALVLQFRRGMLTGWKKDWRVRKPWLL
jgi:outer membrane protein assembly factor BamE (lipoprotein component of BamABCDE complex)